MTTVAATQAPARAGTESLWDRKDVMAFFKCERTATYGIAGLESCRVKVPGTSLVRFDPVKVRALVRGRERGR